MRKAYRNYAYSIVLLIITLILIESISYVFISILINKGIVNYRPRYFLSEKQKNYIGRLAAGEVHNIRYDSKLGWAIKELLRDNWIRTNSDGMRNVREFNMTSDPGVIRIAAFGDSFTFGDDVKNHETWTHILDKTSNKTEVLNFGVSGYGLDQAFLKYLYDGSRFNPQIVLIGYMTEDIYRSVNTFKPFYYRDTGLAMTKPRFVFRNNQLSLMRNPINELKGYRNLLVNELKTLSILGNKDFYYNNTYKLGSYDVFRSIRLFNLFLHMIKQDSAKKIYLNHIYNVESEAYIVTREIFEEFYNTVIKNNSKPLILLLPHDNDIRNY